MLCDAPSDGRSGAWTAWLRAPRVRSCDPRDLREQRRREIEALLEEIRDPSPRPAEIARAGHEATADSPARGRPGRIGARLAALDGAG